MSKQISKLQNSTKLLLPKVAFGKCVRSMISYPSMRFRIQAKTLLALQEVAEDFIATLFTKYQQAVLHSKIRAVQEKGFKEL